MSTLSDFQLKTIDEVSKRPEFSHYVAPISYFSTLPKNSPINLLWFDKDNQINLTRIGVGRILREVKP